MIKRQDIHIRDPFILVDGGHYYLYGTKGKTSWGAAEEFQVFVSDDLENFSDPVIAFKPPEGFWADRNFWAPEVHKWRGAYYMFASFFAQGKMRATQILRAGSPLGPFTMHGEHITPPDWMCLDGSFYVDKDGKPWMFFCHEWLQIADGGMCAIPLKEDLTAPDGEAVTLFHASNAPWCQMKDGNGITDGPFLLDMPGGDLVMLWSTGGVNGYCIGVARSKNGVLGPWTVDEQPLFDKDGGHGMIFTSLEGETLLAIHSPNTPSGAERPIFIPVKLEGNDISLIGSKE